MRYRATPPLGYKKSTLTGVWSVPPGERLVSDLKRFQGNIQYLLMTLDSKDEQERAYILTAIFLELGKEENSKHRAEWMALDAAYKRAMVLLLETGFLTALSGKNGDSMKERAEAMRQLLPLNFKMVDLKFFLAAYMPERYGPPSTANVTGTKRRQEKPAEDEPPPRDDSIDAIMKVLDGEPDCQEAEDLPE